jgi:hypothetical protein
MKYVILTKGWDGMPVAYHLATLDEQEVFVGQVQSDKELGIESGKEDEEEKKSRLSQYDGMLKKFPAEKLVSALKKVRDKDDYFIFCDQNNIFAYAEELLKYGFTKGLFPTKDDYELEKDRAKAMEFVESNYSMVKIIPYHEFSTVEEARQYVEETEVPLVIQSEGDHVPTICPGDDVEMNHAEILAALDKYASEYSKGKIIIKEKLVRPIEITPQIVFWNGQPVFTDVDIETKNLGDGENNGNQVGCATNLVVGTEFNDPINEIAFPPIVYAMAKKRKGLFVWDISLYITENGIYFGEFCPNRFGYDSLLTEMTMAHGPHAFFEKIMSGENPISDFKFGTAVRVFNLNRSAEIEINIANPKPIWLYEVKKKGDKLLSLGDCWDLGVVTGRGDTFEDAVKNVYDNLSTLSFKEKYTRLKTDFLADYPTSIAHRFSISNHIFFEAPDLEKDEGGEQASFEEKISIATSKLRQDYEIKINDLMAEHQKQLDDVKEEIKNILNG